MNFVMHPHSLNPTTRQSPSNTCQKFFTLKAPNNPQSPNTDISTCRSILTSQDMYNSQNHGNHSDIIERIESYELRVKKSLDIEIIKENLYLWEKCFDEIIPELKKHQSDTTTGLIKLCSHYADISKKLIRINTVNENDNQYVLNEISKKFNTLESENKKLNYELEEIKKEKKFEMQEIEKEIAEIFGKHDVEIQALKIRNNYYKDNANTETSDLLNEIWKFMNHQFDIPEQKNGEFLGMDPSEIPGLLSKKFDMIHKFTVKKVTEMIRSRKNVSNAETQTYGEYIDPTAHLIQAKAIEKLQLQLSSALLSIEKYRENFGTKVNIVETLETEKNTLTNEVIKYKKEFESTKHSFDKINMEIQKVNMELDSIKHERERLLKENAGLVSEVAEHDKKLKEIIQISEKLEKNCKEKDEKVKNLEKVIAKRKKNGNPEDKEKEEATTKIKQNSKFDEKEFMNSIKSKPRKNTKEGRTENSENSGKMTTADTQIMRPQNLIQGTSSISANEAHSINNSSNNPTNNASPNSKSPKSKLIIEKNGGKKQRRSKLEKIDEVNTPIQKDIQREGDPFMNSSDIHSRSRTSKSPTAKVRGTSRESKYVPNEDEDISRQKSREKSRRADRKSRKSSTSFLNIPNPEENLSGFASHTDSDEDYASSSGADYLKIPRKSRGSSCSEKSEHSEVSMAERIRKKNTKGGKSEITGTEELSFIHSIEFSKAIQFNGIVPEAEEGRANEGIYILPYNPNQYFGLRGDAYYHTKNAVFSAQPRIPDLKDSYVFKSPYHLKDNKPTFL